MKNRKPIKPTCYSCTSLIVFILLSLLTTNIILAQQKTRIVTTKYSNSDVAIIRFDASEAPYNADKTGVSDATNAIQNAINDCADDLGGIVYLPEGTYRINGNIRISEGVTLRGDWKEPTDNNKSVAGTVLHIYSSKGEDSDDINIVSAITLESGVGIRDLSILYPEQNATTPIPYPYTIHGVNRMQTIMNVTLVNSYKGIKFEPKSGSVGHPYIKNVYGYPLKNGVLLNHAAMVPRIDGVHFAPAYWSESGLPGSPTNPDALSDVVRGLESTGLLFLHSDNGIVGNVSIQGYDVGIGFNSASDGKSSNMKVYDFEITNCRVGINALNYKSQGWTFTKGSINVDGTNAIAVNQKAKGTITFNGISFSSAKKLLYSSKGSLSLTNCHFKSWNDDNGIYLADGSLVCYGNTFSKTLSVGENNIYLTSGVEAAAISGNTFESSSPSIVSKNTNWDLIVIDTENTYPVYRHDYKSYNAGAYYKPAKVGTASLFNVQDYGAVGDIETDNTLAFQSALDAAKANGGGTVYVPGGAYRFDAEIVVPTGVELRGVHDLPIYSGYGRSLLLSYVDTDNPGEDAFISLEENSGIRGVIIIRPQQTYSDVIPSMGKTIYDWPYAIRALGDNVTIVNTVVANADKGIDISTPGGGHYLNWYMTTPLRECLNIQTGTNPIAVDNMQTNPGLFCFIRVFTDWTLFSKNNKLTSNLKNYLAPRLSESKELFPTGNAVNMIGDGEVSFYANFYNNPFEGFVINGSPKMVSLLSGGEGEQFYKVESEGAGGIDLEIISNTYHPIESDPATTGFGSFQLNSGSTGSVKILNTTSFGAPNIGYRMNNGELIMQSAFQTVELVSLVEARGDAKVSVEGGYYRNGMSSKHATSIGESASINIYGTFSRNKYSYLGSVNVAGSTPRGDGSPIVNVAKTKNCATIFPNPSTDLINVSGVRAERILVYDLTGKILIDQVEKINQISIAELTNGLYILKVITEKDQIINAVIQKQ